MPRTEIPDIRHTVADGCRVAAEFVRETEEDHRAVNYERRPLGLNPRDHVHIRDQRKVTAASDKIKVPAAFDEIEQGTEAPPLA